MLLRLGLPVRNVSASGLEDSLVSIPVADATGKDVSASGLKRLRHRWLTPPAGMCRPMA